MRAWKKEPMDQLRERYLGEIAPLLEAAREVEMLSPGEKKHVRKRIARTLFGTRSIFGMRGRLVPVLVALALLVFGGAAFATAQRLGLLPRLGSPAEEAPAPPTSAHPGKRRAASRAHATTDPSSVAPAEPAAPSSQPAEAQPFALPAVPDPILAPSPMPVWVLAPPAKTAPSSGALAVAHKEAVRPGSALAMAAPSSRPAAPVMLAPAAEVVPSASVPTPAGEPAPTAGRPEPETLAPAPVPMPSSAPVLAAPVTPPAPVAAPTVPAPPPAPKTAKPVSPDQALFGQALRKLRTDNDPAGALASLHEHARDFPKSALAGERLALEVEALLALHRDGDALALLDLMALDQLPRSGERLVVRGELRAAAGRWHEAAADFDRALARVSGSPSWHERALWGRGAARLHVGDRAGGLADIERYRATYPRGRFIAEAVKIVPNP